MPDKLEPLFWRAWELHCEPRPPQPPRKLEMKDGKIPLEDYKKAVEADILANYTARDEGRTALLAEVAAGKFPGLTRDDANTAYGLFSAALSETFWVEQQTGGGPGTEAEVQQKYPGLPEKLYERMMTWIAARNH